MRGANCAAQSESEGYMSIVIVGGHDRMHCRYKEICGRYGCKCKVFTQCPRNLKAQIGRPNLVLFFKFYVHRAVFRFGG